MEWCQLCEVLPPVTAGVGCSVDWITFPDGVRLPSIPSVIDCECGARYGEFHHRDCFRATCPRCFECLKSCGCLSSDDLFPRKRLERPEIVDRINAIASEYTGEVVRLDDIIRATPGEVVRLDDIIRATPDAALWAKLIAFEEMIVKFRAGKRILDMFPAVVVRKWKDAGDVPVFIRNAEISVKYARDLWFRHFWI